MISIQNNMGGMRAMDGLQQSHLQLQVSLERLSTGLRINRAEDDAAGVMQRDRFTSQTQGLTEAIRNIQTAQGMIQVAEQGLNKVTEALQQMRSLAVRAADDNLTDTDRANIQNQVKGLLKEINSRAQTTVYNGHNLLDGSITDSVQARNGSVRVQTNSFLATGAEMVSSTSTTGAAATSSGAVSQGSYEVKLVFSGKNGVLPSTTSRTDLKGTLNGPATFASTTTVNQIVTDRNGGAHIASFTFSELSSGNRNYSYSVTIADAGVYKNQDGSGSQTFSGTMSFNADGSIATLDGHPPGALQRDVIIQDATAGGQAWKIDFGGLNENQHVATQNAATTNNGAVGTPSTTFNVGGAGANQLLSTHVVSDSVTTTQQQLFDRTGTDHSVSVTYTKLANDAAGETWAYSVNGLSGGVWDGANSGNTSGTLHFTAAGALDAVNGTGTTNVSMRVGDGTAAGQTISINFAGLNVGAADNVAQVATGGTGNPTTQIQLKNNLLANSGSTPGVDVVAMTVIDRTGTNSTTGNIVTGKGPVITFSQVGSTNTWNYTITAPTDSGFNGFGSNLQGQVSFNSAGNATALDGNSTLTKTVNFGDGTSEGQSINLDFSQLNMARTSDLTQSGTDGGQGTQVGEVNAVVYFSDGTGTNGALNPVSTLIGVDLGAKTYSAGGVAINVAQASTLDVGLTSYVKAYTFISAINDDKSLQFQIGSDEGQTNRVGIAKMDVQALFRGHGIDADYSNVDLSNTLKAQDLIGQVDDAINFVSAQNLKVGQFANSFSRTLEVQRQQMTSISGALSNINDTDMAVEATQQSKRSILVQSGTAMVAQANTQGQFLLQLLR